MKALTLIALFAVAMNAQAGWHISQPTPSGSYYESAEFNDALYANSESCEQQAKRTVQRALGNIEAMCQTTEQPMNCVIESMQAMEKELVSACLKGSQ